jgi:hypothetical protein
MRNRWKPGCPDRWRFVVCARCLCGRGVSRELARLPRTQTKCHGNCHTHLSRGGDATTCPRETETVHRDGKRSAESGCSGIGSMRISVCGYLARSRGKHDLAYLMGRSCCSSGHRASDRLGRPRSDTWESLRLSLKNVANMLHPPRMRTIPHPLALVCETGIILRERQARARSVALAQRSHRLQRFSHL